MAKQSKPGDGDELEGVDADGIVINESPGAEGARSFTRFLDRVDDGYGSIDMSIELQKLLKNMLDHAQSTRADAKGKYTLALNFTVAPNGVVNAGYEVSVRTPKRKTGKSTMWVTNGGNLSDDNPRQQKLPLREIERPRVRDIENTNNGDRRNIRDV